jgi:hypothetical protein
MSKVRSLITGWVGYGDGGAILLEAGQEFDDGDQIARERPELFTEPERLEVVSRPARGRVKPSDE